VIRTKTPSFGWLILINIIFILIALPDAVNAMPASNHKYINGGAGTQTSSTAARIVPGKITYQVKEGDTFITVLTSQGVSMTDALYASKNVDKNILKRIRPGDEIDLRMKTGKPFIIEIGYSSPSSKRKVIYSGKAISIKPFITGTDSKATKESITKSSIPDKQIQENIVAIPGMNPEELTGNILSAADGTFCSVFNAPQEVQAKIRKETQDLNRQLLKSKNEKKKKDMMLASTKRHKSQTLANRKMNEHSRYAYSQKKRSTLLASYDDESQSDAYEDNTDDAAISDNPELREKLISVADTYKGIPYRRGGASTSATDCSGLTMQIYRDLGLNLPRSSSEQFHVGIPRKKDELEKGDLVFFSTTSPYKKIKVQSKKNPNKKIVKYIKAPRRITHVGIYVGDGKFIHAPRPGHTVTVESLNTSYYRKNYVGARSVIR
jgi:cell wall-associated NlpC family hydrolase